MSRMRPRCARDHAARRLPVFLRMQALQSAVASGTGRLLRFLLVWIGEVSASPGRALLLRLERNLLRPRLALSVSAIASDRAHPSAQHPRSFRVQFLVGWQFTRCFCCRSTNRLGRRAEGHCDGMAPIVFWTAAFGWLETKRRCLRPWVSRATWDPSWACSNDGFRGAQPRVSSGWFGSVTTLRPKTAAGAVQPIAAFPVCDAAGVVTLLSADDIVSSR